MLVKNILVVQILLQSIRITSLVLVTKIATFTRPRPHVPIIYPHENELCVSVDCTG